MIHKLATTARFASWLETRIALLLAAKVRQVAQYRQTDALNCLQEEKNMAVPASQRLLLCILFRECRLLTRSLKP